MKPRIILTPSPPDADLATWLEEHDLTIEVYEDNRYFWARFAGGFTSHHRYARPGQSTPTLAVLAFVNTLAAVEDRRKPTAIGGFPTFPAPKFTGVEKALADAGIPIDTPEQK